MSAKPLSLTQTAALMNVHRNTVAGWISKGCPVVARADRSRGIEWQLLFSEVADWRIERAVADAVAGLHGHDGQTTKAGAARRRAVALATIAEIDAQDRLQSVVLRSDAEAVIDHFVGSIRDAFADVGAKIADRTAALTSSAKINELCLNEINDAFRVAQADFAARCADAPAAPDGKVSAQVAH